jgi:hypothetical protein
MNVRYRVDLSQIERTELRALLSGGKHASRRLKRAQICWPPMPGPATRRLQGASAWAARPCTGPSDASWKAIWSGR